MSDERQGTTNLEKVRKALETNPNVDILEVLMGKIGMNFYGGRDYVTANVEFVVTPSKRLDYTPEELAIFLRGLVPDLKPVEWRMHDKSVDQDLVSLSYDDVIGHEKITRYCTLTDTELIHAFGFNNGERTVSETVPYVRRTWVKAVPPILSSGKKL